MFTLKFGTTLLYSVPSMVLYFLTILMVNRFRKDFSRTFVKVYFLFFVFNNITFFNSFITVRVPQNTCKDCLLSFLFKAHTQENPSWFPLNIFYFIHFNMAYTQFFLIFLTCLNRFSMIFWSSTYEQVWDKLFPGIVLLVVILPVPFTYTIVINSCYYIYTESLDCYTVSTGASFNRLVINDNNRQSVLSQIAVTALPYVSDGLTLIHPWMFLAFSTKARRCFMLIYLPKYVKVSKVTTVSITRRK